MFIFIPVPRRVTDLILGSEKVGLSLHRVHPLTTGFPYSAQIPTQFLTKNQVSAYSSGFR